MCPAGPGDWMCRTHLSFCLLASTCPPRLSGLGAAPACSASRSHVGRHSTANGFAVPISPTQNSCNARRRTAFFADTMKCKITIRSVTAGIALTTLVCAVAGCATRTRSISNSGYNQRYGFEYSDKAAYRGELCEYDVIGLDASSRISQTDIDEALNSKISLEIPKESSILLIQSGAMIPDDGMIESLEQFYRVSVLPGMPTTFGSNSWAMAVRLIAAKGGHDTVVVYWGILETSQKQFGANGLVWVPLVGRVIPEEAQDMRIRMMIAVVDVKTGRSDIFAPPACSEHRTATVGVNREEMDQQQVTSLKSKAYSGAGPAIAKRYSAK